MRIKHYKSFNELVAKVLYRVFYGVSKWFICTFIPVNRKKFMFVSKPSFSDNGKALYEYLLEINKDVEYVWLINDDLKNDKLDYKNTIFILNAHQPFSSMYHTLTSGIVFFTHDSPVGYYGKRKGQMVINLWHGCGYKDSIKRDKSWMDRKQCDYSLVPGPIFVETKSKAWQCEKQTILPIGYPRYDLLMKDNISAKQYCDSIRKGNRYIVFWMPTFRNSTSGYYPESNIDSEYDLLPLSSNQELIELNEYCCKQNVQILVKRHPSQIKYSCEDLVLTNIEFISNNDLNKHDIDLYSLLHYADALISDYSSVSVDFLLLNRPIAFCLSDYESYKSKRGFVFDDPLQYMPGNHIYNVRQLKEFLESIIVNEDVYAADRAKLMPVMHNVCDNYCKRIAMLIEEKYSE